MVDGGGQVRFGEHVVDLSARTVERSGEPISLEPQVFDVLAMLVEHRDRVVSKLELLDRVWGDRFVSPATLTSRIRDLRAALGDTGRSQHVIKTAHGRGFRFVASVDGSDGPERSDGARQEGLVGRSREVADVRQRLGSARLVTLVGPGGVGKTRLMEHVLTGTDAHVCELVDARDRAAVIRSILVACEVSERPDVEPLDALVEALGGTSALVAVDNCEHVIDDAVRVVADILQRCPGVSVLATSRRPLRLADETVVRLGPLDDDAAVELFVERAADHGVDLDVERRPEIVRLCDRLDRLPLAIELAASKVRALPIGEVVRLLDRRFDLLRDDASDVDRHHRALEETIAWSVDLLTAEQRHLLAQLSVFVGTFDLEAVETVCRPRRAVGGSGVIADLVALVDLSLVVFDASTGRYRLLESIRIFSADLGVDPDTEERWRQYVLSVVEAAGPLHASELTDDLDRIREVWPAVRAVVADAQRRGDAATVHRIVAAATRYAEQTFSFEVLDWAEPGESTTSIAVALLSSHRGEFDRAAEELNGLGDVEPSYRPLVLHARLWYSYFTGDLDAADRCVAEIRSSEDGTGSYVEVVSAIASQFLDKGAQRTFDPAVVARLDELGGTGDPILALGVEMCTALRLDWSDAADVAIERLTATIDEARRRGLAFLASGASTARSIALAVSPDAESSARVLRATLRSYADAGSWQFALADFGSTALTLVRHGQAREAAELLGSREAAGYGGDASAEVARTAAAECAAALGDRGFTDALRQGTARDPQTATRLAIAALGRVV